MYSEPLLGWSFVLIVGGIVYVCFDPHRFYWGAAAVALGCTLIYVHLRSGDKRDMD